MTSISFKDQFKLTKSGNTNEDFYSNKYSFLNAPTTYGIEPVAPDTMHPFNQFETLKNSKNLKYLQPKNYRDNTIVINDYHTQEVGQYAKHKTEITGMFEPMANENALAGDTKIVDKIGTMRYTDSLHNKANEFPDNTYVRAEQIDGVPITFTVRPREKSLEERRGLGINSQRLDPNARLNQVGFTGEGTSTDPNNIMLTKYKMKSYRNQDTIDDLLRTTGAITRPEWRSLVKEPATVRSYDKSIEGPAIAPVMKTEYRNLQTLNPTIRTDYEENTVVLNPKSVVEGMTYRNNMPANPTMRTDYEHNTIVMNPTSLIENTTYRNTQSANPTLRMDYEENTNIINPRGIVDNSTYRNNMSANPTLRMEYEENTNIINPRGLIDNTTYHNNMSANPTMRTDYEENTNIINLRGRIDNMTYRNNMAATPTMRTDYEENTNVINPKGLVDNTMYRNMQSAQPTLRENNIVHINAGNNPTSSYVYENNIPANPTLRDNAAEHVGASVNVSKSNVYKNDQPANPTHRISTEDNYLTGPSFNQASSIYKKYGDTTRSGVVEEVLAKDYMGTEMAFVPKNESRLQSTNFIQNQSIEDSIDLSKRELMGGGVDRIPQGRDNIGIYFDWDRREKNGVIANRVRNVGVNYVQEIPSTRGQSVLQERSGINYHVSETLNENPFVNNMVYKGTHDKDINRETTFFNTRDIDRQLDA